MREGWSFSCGKEVMEINAAEVLKPGIAPWQSFFFVCGAPRKQQHSCSYLVKCGTSNRIRFAGDAAAQKSEQVFLCSSINWKCWSWGEKTKQMHTAHLFLLILCPFLLQKKKAFTALQQPQKISEIIQQMPSFGLKAFFFQLMGWHQMAFSSILTSEWWKSPVCQKCVWGWWPAQPWSRPESWEGQRVLGQAGCRLWLCSKWIYLFISRASNLAASWMQYYQERNAEFQRFI